MVTSLHPDPALLSSAQRDPSINRALFMALFMPFLISLGSIIGCVPIELEMTTCEPLPNAAKNFNASDEDRMVSGYWVLELRLCDTSEESVDDQFLLLSSKILTIDHHLGDLYLLSLDLGGDEDESISSETSRTLSSGYHLGAWRASPPPELRLPPGLFEEVATFDHPLSVKRVIRGDEGQIDLIAGVTTLLYRFENLPADFILRRVEQE